VTVGYTTSWGMTLAPERMICRIDRFWRTAHRLHRLKGRVAIAIAAERQLCTAPPRTGGPKASAAETYLDDLRGERIVPL
jgi:hypothetical protein